MFAVAMSLVILISTAVLLYQFWAQSLLESEQPATNDEQPELTSPLIEKAA